MRRFVLILSATSIAACGGSGGGSTAPQVFTTLDLSTNSANDYQYGPVTTLGPTALDATGHSMPIGNVTPSWTISDPSKVVMSGDNVVVRPGATGLVMINATLTLNGITKSSPPVSETVDIAPSTGSFVGMTSPGSYGSSTSSYSPTSIAIKAGGTVTWSGLQSGIGHNVHFSAVTPFASGTSAMSGTPGSVDQVMLTLNLAPGTYTFHCDNHPTQMTGTIVVH